VIAPSADQLIGVAAISRVTGAVLLFIGVALVALWAMWLLLSGSARRSLLMQRGGVELGRRRLVDRLDASLIRTRRGADLAARLRSAGSELTPARFLAAAAGSAVAGLAAGSLLFPLPLAVAAGAIAGWSWFTRLARRLEKRRERFVSQLPEVARLLANGAAAGLSMPAAIELCVREVDAPAREELQIVIDELTLGRSLADSLASLQRRLPSREIAVLMTTLIIQQRAGGDVVRALHELSGTLDARRETLREVATLMAGAVYTSYLVPLLGVAALILLNSISSNTLERMTTRPLGIAAFAVAGCFYTAGWLAIRRATRIEV
jgi:tight adherence protein B